MVVLKHIKHLHRVKGSTLMETLVATVLIVIVFMIASMILNNLFSNTITSNTQAIDNHLNELQYLQQHDQLQLPYNDIFQNWSVTIIALKENDQMLIEFEATNIKTNKTISITRSDNQ